MDRATQRRFAEEFRRLHHTGTPLLLPNAWDAMSARLYEAAGFPAIATTSAGMAWALGWPDGEVAPWPEIVAATRRIVCTVKVPVTADIEEGFAASDAEFADHIGEIVDVGAVGVNIEDGNLAGPDPIRTVAAAAARIRAARAEADAAGVALVINARTDLYLRNIGDPATRFDETVARGRAYLEAGADCVYPIGLGDGPTLGRLAAALAAPVNVMARPGIPGMAELKRLGIARISTASLPTLAAMSGIKELAAKLREATDFDGLGSAMKHPDAQKLFAKRD